MTGLVAGLALGLAGPAGAEGQGLPPKKKSTNKPPKSNSRLTAKQRKTLIRDLERKVRRALDDVQRYKALVNSVDREEKKLKSEIDKEHDKQVRLDRQRKALSKKRQRVLRDLRRNSKTLTLAEKDAMVRQANGLQGDIKKAEKAIKNSKAVVRNQRRSQSKLQFERSRYLRSGNQAQDKVNELKAEIKALR